MFWVCREPSRQVRRLEDIDKVKSQSFICRHFTKCINHCLPFNEIVEGYLRIACAASMHIVHVILAGKTHRSSNPSVFSPLMFYIQANEIEALKKLLERTDINSNKQDDYGNSALMMAASGGHLEALELLLRAGANIKLSNIYDAAISLLEVNQNADVFDQLMLEYALEEVNGPIGFYSLHRVFLAARRGYGGVCEFLISSGAKCDTKTQGMKQLFCLQGKKGAETMQRVSS
ncbi:hypothetical protein V6N12_030198 [Hibiscus sabdariffa]|uniref:Uncharacterized protein n=1 Tax=Hibiscus sabdariffa TaxID=183260 RepID=A0ABR2C203_9ROSI